MIRHCDGTDVNLRSPDREVGACGRTFDDVNHWTICPHDELHKMTPEQVEQSLAVIDKWIKAGEKAKQT